MSYPNSSGYSNRPTGGNPRQTEAWALTEAARRMADGKSGAEADLLAAVRLNWRLWTIFQAELASPECAIEIDLRANMLTLCNYVDKVTVELLAEMSHEKVDSLISINRHIAAGLFTQPSGGSEAAQGENAAPTANIGSLTA